MSSSSVIKHVSWTSVLNVLEVHVPRQTLPTDVICPLCRGRRLRIYQDNISKGAWHYCFSCESSGDMVDLAASVWSMGLKATICKLRDMGVPIPGKQDYAVEVYLKKHEKLDRNAALWSRAQKNVTRNSAEVHGLRHRLGLNMSCSPERWATGPGLLLGSSHCKEVNGVLLPDSLNKWGFATNVFRGAKWGEVLVTPYYSGRKQICGFAFVGRKGVATDRVYKFLGRTREAGLAGLWTVDASKSMFGEYVIAVEDPWFMIRLQLRHFAGSTVPLPLVAWHDGGNHRTEETWKVVERRKPVFWVHDEVIPSHALHQAIVSDGYIAIPRMQSFDGHSTSHYLRNNEPREILRKLLRRAKPWKDALADWAEDSSDGAVEETLGGLVDYKHDMKMIGDISPRIKRLLRIPVPELCVELFRSTIVEKDGKWWLRNRAGTDVLMNATMRVNAPVTHIHKGIEILYYSGNILFDGKTIPFEIPIREARTNLRDKLRAVTFQATGKMVYIANVCQTRLLEVAIAFHQRENGLL